MHWHSGWRWWACCSFRSESLRPSVSPSLAGWGRDGPEIRRFLRHHHVRTMSGDRFAIHARTVCTMCAWCGNRPSIRTESALLFGVCSYSTTSARVARRTLLFSEQIFPTSNSTLSGPWESTTVARFRRDTRHRPWRGVTSMHARICRQRLDHRPSLRRHALTRGHRAGAVSYTHLTLPTKRIV